MRAANDRGPTPDPDIPDPTDEQALTATPHRPRRGELHGADDPQGWNRGRFASLRTVPRTVRADR